MSFKNRGVKRSKSDEDMQVYKKANTNTDLKDEWRSGIPIEIDNIDEWNLYFTKVKTMIKDTIGQSNVRIGGIPGPILDIITSYWDPMTQVFTCAMSGLSQESKIGEANIGEEKLGKEKFKQGSMNITCLGYECFMEFIIKYASIKQMCLKNKFLARTGLILPFLHTPIALLPTSPIALYRIQSGSISSPGYTCISMVVSAYRNGLEWPPWSNPCYDLTGVSSFSALEEDTFTRDPFNKSVLGCQGNDVTKLWCLRYPTGDVWMNALEWMATAKIFAFDKIASGIISSAKIDFHKPNSTITDPLYPDICHNNTITEAIMSAWDDMNTNNDYPAYMPIIDVTSGHIDHSYSDALFPNKGK